MQTAMNSTKKAESPAKEQDATTLLRADHKHVSELFAEYEKSRSPSKKKELVALLCTELSVHAQVEEEIFYPAVKQALKDKELVPEAVVEQAKDASQSGTGEECQRRPIVIAGFMVGQRGLSAAGPT